MATSGMAMREMSVAHAATVAPIASKPQCPKMKTQFSTTFIRLHPTTITIDTTVLPTPSRNCLNAKKSMTAGILKAMSL